MQFLRKIAFPISLIYALVVYIRNYLFDHGLLSSRAFETPVICVGNLSIGGTGKTPMIELLIELLKGRSIAVLSRGYRRKTSGFIVLTSDSTVAEVGDEPLQISRKYPEIQFAVDEDRQRGISNLQHRFNPDLILLDDGFQHRKVRPSFSILLTAYDKLYTDDWYLPTGNLRDGKKQAGRAAVILVTKCPTTISEKEQLRIIGKIAPSPSQTVLFSCLEYNDQISGFKAGTPLTALNDAEVTLVTGIADPKPLVDYLEGIGMQFEHLAFKDHHFFSRKEIALLNARPSVLTTEKDYVRAKNEIHNLSYIGVRHKLLGNGREVLMEKLAGVLGS